MSRELSQNQSTFNKAYEALTTERDRLLKNLENRGYSTRTSISDVDTLYHIKDGAGCYRGSACEKAVKAGRFSGSIESQIHYNRQLLVKDLTKKVESFAPDETNAQTLKLRALGYKTTTTEYPNAIRIKVFQEGSNEVRELNLNTKDLLDSSKHKAIASWLGEITADLKKQRGFNTAINS